MPRDVKYFTFNSFKDILSDNDINTIDTNAKTKTEDMGSMTRATKMSCCPLYHRVGRNVDRCYLVNGGRYSSLEALPVDNAWAGLVILLLGDPHLLEGGEGGQD